MTTDKPRFKKGQAKLEKINQVALAIAPFMTRDMNQRIKWALDRADKTYQELGQEIGVSPQAVQQWVRTKKPVMPRTERLWDIAVALNVDYHWLTTGSGKPDTSLSDSLSVSESTVGKRVPLLNIESVNSENIQVFMSQALRAQQFLFSTEDCGPKTHGYQIADRSMEPEFHIGEPIIVDPDVKPVPGDFVVMDCKPLRVTLFREFKYVANQRIALVPLNAAWRTEEFPETELGKSYVVIGTLIEHTKRRRR